MFNLKFLLLIIVVVSSLLGCQGLKPLEPRQNGPLKKDSQLTQDGPPSYDFDVSHLRDAIPKKEPITRAGNKNPYQIFGKTYVLLPSAKGYSEEGIASWYGRKFHGRKTANGEIYDMYKMTAAHTTLPIPTFVRVTNLDNGRQIVVRVNDRGPFHGGRIIDLSYAAAKKLGYDTKGTARVRVEVVDVESQQKAVVEPTRPEPFLL